MDSIERWGDDIDSAVSLALKELKADRSEVDIEVLEEPSKGFFGIGSKLAHVRVTKKSAENAPKEKEEKHEEAEAPRRVITKDSLEEAASKLPEEDRPAPGERRDRNRRSGGKRNSRRGHGDGRRDDRAREPREPREAREPRWHDAPADEAPEEAPDMTQSAAAAGGEAPQEAAERPAWMDRPKQERPKKAPLSEIANLPDSVEDDDEEELDFFNFRKAMDQLPAVEEHQALTFLHDVITKMGLTVSFECHADEKNVLIEISGPDTRTVIGKRGQTLDALQYLTSLVVNKNEKDYVKVVLDAEDYRARRQKTLQNLAERLARKVMRTKRPVKLEPMNPYERKVIHSSLQSNPYVTTRSEGQDPYRRVIIELKK